MAVADLSVQAVATLVEKFDRVASSFSKEELASYKLLLGVAAGGLAPQAAAPIDDEKAQAFGAVLRCLSFIHPTGIIWQGRLPFVSDRLLEKLQAEAESSRARAERADRYLLCAAGPVASSVGHLQEMKQFIDQLPVRIEPSGAASYIYYEGDKAGLDPHVDAESYGVNMIFVLKHVNGDKKPASKLVIYEPSGKANRILLAPGECVILHASGTVHARENLETEEEVTLLTLGFRQTV